MKCAAIGCANLLSPDEPGAAGDEMLCRTCDRERMRRELEISNAMARVVSDYYDREGAPIDTMRWAALVEDAAYKRVALDQIGDAQVSTVWLGLDHAWEPGPPLIFETMVFGGPLNEECERYSTEAEALAGHAAMVARVKDAPASAVVVSSDGTVKS